MCASVLVLVFILCNLNTINILNSHIGLLSIFMYSTFVPFYLKCISCLNVHFVIKLYPLLCLPPPFTAFLTAARCNIMQLSPWRSLGDGLSLDNVKSPRVSLFPLSLCEDLIPGLRAAESQSRWTNPKRPH